MERRVFSGAVISTTLTDTLSHSGSVVKISEPNTYPLGNTKPFVIVINRGDPSEEKILISSRSGSDLTVLQRGYDGTSAASHNSGSTVDHVLDATAMQDMNDAVYNSIVLYWVGI